MSEKNFYLTTAIHYVTDKPHLGHAYEMIAADVLARYFRQVGRDVYFLTGTDEHGLKVAQAAEKQNIETQMFVDEMAANYQKVWQKLNISYDHFIRTTEPAHEKLVVEFLQKLYDAGEIYQGQYKGLYCVACEEYKTPTELIDNNLCPIHKTPCEKLSEEVYFFRLSKYQKQVIEAIQTDRILIRPQEKKNEILQFLLSQKLEDLAISRSKVSWGIKVPWDESQTIYVWVDALLNYLTGGKNYWPADLQLIGKDIFRFHAIIWPALLLAAHLPLPKEIFIHGFLSINGEKISKTRGNVIDPLELIKVHGVDALRYFLLRETPFGQDGDFSSERFEARYKADLANDLGNLVQRTLVMANNYKIEWKHKPVKDFDPAIAKKIENLDFSGSLELLWQKINAANQKIETEKPWELAKKSSPKLTKIIGGLLDEIAGISEQIKPFLPQTAEEISEQLKSRQPKVIFVQK